MTLCEEKLYDSWIYRLYVSKLSEWGIKIPLCIGGITKRYHDFERKILPCSCQFYDNFNTVCLLMIVDVLN